MKVCSHPALRSCEFTAGDCSLTLQTTLDIPPSVDLDAPVKSTKTIKFGEFQKRERAALWQAVIMKARSPEKAMDVCDEKVTDDGGFLSFSMMIKAKNTLVKDRIWINRFAREFVFQPFIQTPTPRRTMSV